MPTITSYRQNVRRLLSDFNVEVFNRDDLDVYINKARGQVAIESECVRDITTLSTVAATYIYPLSSFVMPTGRGYGSVIDIRVAYIAAAPNVPLHFRTWEWFWRYLLPAAATQGQPSSWAPVSRGTSGSIYFSPTPNGVFSIAADSVMQPADITIDTDVDAVGYPFSDAVPFYAAFLALDQRQKPDDAAKMYQQFSLLMQRASQGSTPSVIPAQFPSGAPVSAPPTVSGNA